ncbi:hypothetical protein [Crocinitomix catalasitica]|uniref:hypothetical protein n=1 Tax=Crocinitomix catalasitica TaxID=184607 RepID=UPI000484E998|nr:hypothetical protein [Crocinitomix catalasitica]
MRLVTGLKILTIIGFIVACKKVPLPNLSENSNPVYQVQGAIDGEVFNFEVNAENLRITFNKENLRGIRYFSGEIKNDSINEIFKISFAQSYQQKDKAFSPSLTAGEKQFLVHQKGRIYFDFQAMGNQKKYMQIKNELGVFENVDNIEVEKYGKQTLQIKFQDIGEEVFNVTLNHGFENELINARFESQGSDSTIFLSSNNFTAKHKWFINDSLVGTGQFYVGHLTDGVYLVNHTVLDKDNNLFSYETLLRIKGGQHFWQMDQFYEIPNKVEKDNFGKMECSYFKNGEWYTSNLGQNNLNQNIQIDSVIQFFPKQGDQNFALFNFQFNAVLYNSTLTDSLQLTNIHGVSAIEIE